MIEEVWRPIPGFENHGQVSNYGRVRSRKGKERKTFVSSSGYERVGFNGKHTITIHRLVALAFCEGHQEHLTVNHKDGNKLNNTAWNLEWVTHSDKLKHAFATGLKRPSRSNLIIEDSEFEKIIARVKSGEVQRKIAREYGVSPAAICKRLKEWKGPVPCRK